MVLCIDGDAWVLCRRQWEGSLRELLYCLDKERDPLIMLSLVPLFY
ncbi:uncharacterized protein J3R85_011443 [Psidium guajava]|nr:uncharacterized protein J3R85_011443 [Psidium guajava]